MPRRNPAVMDRELGDQGFDCPPEDVERIVRVEHDTPHGVLGPHPARLSGADGTVVRVWDPEADKVFVRVTDGLETELNRIHNSGLFAGFVLEKPAEIDYRVRSHYPNGSVFNRDDPYRFGATVGEMDRYLFNLGRHRRLWEVLGARRMEHEGAWGVAFAVWAPNAVRVSVVGEFCMWDGRRLPMHRHGESGVFEIFIPGLEPGAHYRFEIKTRKGEILHKSDPMAKWSEAAPNNASRVFASDYTWEDGAWMTRRPKRAPATEPMSIYEVHLGSWCRDPDDPSRRLSFREIAPRLVEHVKKYGFTHLELLPIAEHPFEGSWGYQVTGYYSPTARLGTPDDLRFFVDHCHQNDIGVLLDWVPAHFPADDWALARFDGSPLYEHPDPRRGVHPDWGTYIFDYGRLEVQNFLIANALYWFKEFHIDGLRVDAVASMLYLNYSRNDGEWLPNAHGGIENLEAISLLRELNKVISEEAPGCVTIAEESTTWPGVTAPVDWGGLGFTFKWNMGWMHDTLEYFGLDPVYRRDRQTQLTFAMMYEYSERFTMPLSHDEVVHGKRSLLEKMHGDRWQKFANLRCLLTYMFTRPSKKLLFMGTELAPQTEWNHDVALPWELLQDPKRQAFTKFLQKLGRLYREHPALWALDPKEDGFAWIDCEDAARSIYTFSRTDGDEVLVVCLNLTPIPRNDYRFGVPEAGVYELLFNTDNEELGGSGYSCPTRLKSQAKPRHELEHSASCHLPPLSGLIFVLKERTSRKKKRKATKSKPRSSRTKAAGPPPTPRRGRKQ